MSFLAKGRSGNVLCGLLIYLCLALPVSGKARKDEFYYSSRAQAQKVRGIRLRPFIGANVETRKPALFIGHFYNPKEKKLNENYLEIERKFKFDGFSLFAAQNLTDDLIEKLSKSNHR
jgi:hypothetical protein